MAGPSETKQGLPVDRGWAWMIAVGYFISTFFMVGLAKSFGILLTEFVSYFDVEVATAATIMAVCGAVYTISAPFCVAFGQQLTQRRVVIFGAVFGSIVTSLSCFLVNIEFVIAFYGIGTGLGNACMFGNGLVMVGNYFKKYRSLATGLAMTGASVGLFALPPLLQFFLDEFGLQGTILLVGGLYLHIAISGFLYRPVTFYTRHQKRETESQNKESLVHAQDGDLSGKRNLISTRNEFCSQDDMKECEKLTTNSDIQIETGIHPMHEKVMHHRIKYLSTSTGSFKMASVESLTHLTLMEEKDEKSLKKKRSITLCGKSFIRPQIFHFSVLKMPVVIFYMIVSFLVFFGYFNFILFMPADVLMRGISKYDKALLVSFTGIGDLIGRISVGVLGDLNFVERYKIMATACLLCGLDILIFTFAESYWFMVVLAVLYGLFGGAFVAINAIVLIDFVGLETMPKALGVILLIQGIGAAIGQPILGSVRDKTRSYIGVNFINSICMMLGAILLFCYPLIKKLNGEKKYRVTDPESENEEPETEMTKMMDKTNVE